MTANNPNYQAGSAFVDKRNIAVGKTRVIWARATDSQAEGWVLPGGARTQDRARAYEVAVQLDALAQKVAQ